VTSFDSETGNDPEADWFGEDTATLGDRLTGAREAAGLSQKRLGQALGVRTEVIRAWEDDRKEPRANRLQMLSGLLGVGLTWLITGRGDGPAAPVEASGAAQGDATALIGDLRRLRAEIAATAEQLRTIETRLGHLLDAGRD
jgi:transcriptional regulator with XRE-family HTH domain